MVLNTLRRLSVSGLVECNLCGWTGRRFLTHCAVGYVDRNAFCPNCGSYPRHRGFAWLLEHSLGRELEALDALNGLRLLFAPEPGMMELLGRYLHRLEGADIEPIHGLVRHLEDLQTLSFEDESVAFVSCFHVLEHVPDDRRALRELYRVLRGDALLLLCVPISLEREKTVEFGGPDPKWNDHCYDYGVDSWERLVEAGFSGRSFRLDHLVPESQHRRLALSKDIVYVLRRTAEGEAPEIQVVGGSPA